MMAQPLHVAVIEPVGGHGGMDYYDFGLCGGLASAGVDVVLHTCEKTLPPKDAEFEVRHSYEGIFGDTASWKRGLRYLSGSASAIWSGRREGRDICHFHLFHVGFLQAFNIALAKVLGRRVVITAHDVEALAENLEVPWLSRWVYRRADRVIAHNVASKQELVGSVGLPDQRIALIPHGNYLHAVRPLPPKSEAHAALGITEKSKVILFFGQIKEVKGLDLLLEAMPTVLEKHADVVLLIAGKLWKNNFSAYEAQINRLGISKNCILHIRYIPDIEVPLYYSAADIVVLPYRRIYQSGVVLMAMSYAKAVLVSDLPGMTEIVSDGENGSVFRRGDSADLASKLTKILTDSPSRNRMALEGLKTVRNNYDWNAIGDITKKLYESILQ